MMALAKMAVQFWIKSSISFGVTSKLSWQDFSAVSMILCINGWGSSSSNFPDLRTVAQLLPERFQHVMGDNSGLYHGGDSNGEYRYAHCFSANAGAFIANAGAGSNAGITDLDGGADSAGITGSQRIDHNNEFGMDAVYNTAG